MILNELQILERLVDPNPDRRIVITPLIKPEEQFGPTSVDLRLGTEFRVARRTHVTHLDVVRQAPHASETVYGAATAPSEAMEQVRVSPTEPFILHPGEFALAATLEYVKVPLDLAARLEGRSTWGRLGLQIHATAGFVDPGFEGVLTFELSNVSAVPLPLYPGVRISQICFFQSSKTHLPYNQKRLTKYSGKMGSASSAFYQDPEYGRIRQALESSR